MGKIISILLALVVVVGAAGYYMGRQSVLDARQRPVVVAPEGTQQTRNRMRELPRPNVAPAPTSAVSSIEPHISLPIAGLERKDLQDTFNQARGSERKHEAEDILAPRGTPVLAVDDGVVKKLFLSKPGGITLYQFEPTERYCYYYAHLDSYAPGIVEGMKLVRGQVIGYVGSTGNADPGTPHLHFAIFELGPEKQWWRGTPIDPFPLLVNALNARR